MIIGLCCVVPSEHEASFVSGYNCVSPATRLRPQSVILVTFVSPSCQSWSKRTLIINGIMCICLVICSGPTKLARVLRVSWWQHSKRRCDGSLLSYSSVATIISSCWSVFILDSYNVASSIPVPCLPCLHWINCICTVILYCWYRRWSMWLPINDRE